ncbi:unnamed protein product [Strongylus vulgaris]|uniref:PPM-type phosphatase domain-containing protein n=1 Tax=Strongylus vulgaris TaxID=40348 RepID=A0A3P7KSD0_STRVU|nr:unnamed protein product [Strongylus vulgaris]
MSSNAFLFGVFDGHGGQSCSRHVSVSLFPYICASVLQKHEVKSLPPDGRLEWLFSSADVHLPNLFIDSEKEQVIDYYKAFIENKDLHTVRDALKFAFETCDENLCKAALPNNRGQIDSLHKGRNASQRRAAKK